MKYPTNNIFISTEWTARIAALELFSSQFTIQKLYSLKLAILRGGILADFEEWPKGQLPTIQTSANAVETKVDWVVYRKLLAEQASPEQLQELSQAVPFFQRPFVTPYTSSPYLDLTKPLNPKKSAHSHIYRTERKLTREIGAPVLREFTTPEERAQWFEWYVAFQRASDRISDEQYEILKKWTLDGEKPEWMRLTGLMVGDLPLTMGLFYYRDGVFYYFSSTMNPDPQYRKYGPGKIFVEKLIQHTISIGGTTFDFLQGSHEYKAHWNPTNRILFQCIYPKSIKGYLALQLFKIKTLLKKNRNLETEVSSIPGDFAAHLSPSLQQASGQS